MKVRRGKYDKDDPEAKAARDRVVTIIDSVPPEDLVMSIKRAPSLRGMILGYIAEEMFEKYVLRSMGSSHQTTLRNTTITIGSSTNPTGLYGMAGGNIEFSSSRFRRIASNETSKPVSCRLMFKTMHLILERSSSRAETP